MTIFTTLHREDTNIPFLADNLIAHIESVMQDTPMRQTMVDNLMEMSAEGNDDVDALTNYFDDLRSNDLDHDESIEVIQARELFNSVVEAQKL